MQQQNGVRAYQLAPVDSTLSQKQQQGWVQGLVLLPLPVTYICQDRQMVAPSVHVVPLQLTMFMHNKKWLHHHHLLNLVVLKVVLMVVPLPLPLPLPLFKNIPHMDSPQLLPGTRVLLTPSLSVVQFRRLTHLFSGFDLEPYQSLT